MKYSKFLFPLTFLFLNSDFNLCGAISRNDRSNEEFKKVVEGENDYMGVEFKKRKLMIVLQDEDQEYISALSKKGKTAEIESYKNAIKANNDNLMVAFYTLWKETSYEFIQSGQIKSLTADRLNKGTILNYQKSRIEKIEFMQFNLAFPFALTDKKKNTSFTATNYYFKVSMQNDVPTVADLLFLMRKMKVYFGFEKEYDRTQLEEILAGKTLLLDSTAVGLSEEKIKSSYNFPYKFSSHQIIDSLINNKDKNYVYLKLDTYSGDSQINFMIIDPVDGSILSRCPLTGLTKVTFGGPSEKHQKDFNGSACTYCNTTSGELFRLYTAQAKLNATILKYLSTEKKQDHFGYLISY